VRSRSVVRYKPVDFAVSRPSGDGDGGGTPVPVVVCEGCGVVLTDREAFAAARPGAEVACPMCSSAARWDDNIIMLARGGWLGDEGGGAARLLIQPAGAAAAAEVLAQRSVAKALRDVDGASFPADGEPYARSIVTRPVVCDDDLAEAASGAPADALRFALLFAAAPTQAVGFDGRALAHCTRFLEELRAFAEPRAAAAAELDGEGEPPVVGSANRRRLAEWCATAELRISDNFDALRTHRATRNTMILLDRIRAFEAAASGTPADTAATTAALHVLLRLLEPLAPQVAQELWSASGARTPLSAEPWPVR
jgi:leucyl-tRNA synthetase